MKHLALLLLLGSLVACATQQPFDYGPLLDAAPASILVLPPLDESPEVDATTSWLATVSRPLAERGYYVFPVALVDRILRENGLPTPYEMHAVPLAKLNEVFGADAVLYVTIHAWGTEYNVLASNTVVHYSANMVDAQTGGTIWHGQGRAVRSSADGNQGLLGMLIGALVNQVASSVSDPTPGVARTAHSTLFLDDKRGLLPGPYEPRYEEERQRRLEERAARRDAAASH